MDAQFGEYLKAARSMVDARFLASLRQPRPSAIYLATALIFAQLILSWAIALLGPVWLCWFPFIINCAVTQAMLLWVHEASHFSLLPNQRRNDIWCDIFFAGPIYMSIADYRSRHVSHHAHLGTGADEDGYPYREPIKGARSLGRLMVKVLSGALCCWLLFDMHFGGAHSPNLVRSKAPRWLAPLITVTFNSVLLGLCVWSGRWYLYLVLWVYPLMAVTIALNVVRTIAEHQPEDFPRFTKGKEIAMRPVLRTTLPNWFEKWLMYQANFNYHLEHHLFPAIPQHNLAELHRHLAEKGLYDRFPDCLQRSGFGKFVQLSRNRRNDDFTDSVHDAFAA